MDLTISVLADRPDLAPAMWDMPTTWPEFMRHDPIGGLFYSQVESRFAAFVLVATDETGEAARHGFAELLAPAGAPQRQDRPRPAHDGVRRHDP